MNLKEIKELIEMLKDTDISELEIERSGVKVRLRKGGDVTFHPVHAAHGVSARRHRCAGGHRGSGAGRSCREGSGAGQDEPDQGHLSHRRHVLPVKFAGQTAYVEIGDVVKKGQVLCIIEAMKLMNEIESESAGKIVQILVENGTARGVRPAAFRDRTGLGSQNEIEMASAFGLRLNIPGATI